MGLSIKVRGLKREIFSFLIIKMNKKKRVYIQSGNLLVIVLVEKEKEKIKRI